MKNPSNYPIKCFARIKKITSRTFIIAGALIVIKDDPQSSYTSGSRPMESSERQSHKRSKNAQFQCEGFRPLEPVRSRVADPDPVGSGPFLQDPDLKVFHWIRIRIPDPDPSLAI